MHTRLLLWSLRQRRLRHLINALSTAITVAVVIVFVAVLAEFVEYTRFQSHGQLARILVVPQLIMPGSYSDGLPVSLKPTFEHIDGAKVVQRKLVIAGKHESGAEYVIAGEEDSGVEQNPDFYPIDAAMIDAWKRERPLGAIVTDDTASELHLEVGKMAEIPTSFGPMQMKIVGIYHSLWAHGIAVHFEYMQQFTKNMDTCGYRILVEPSDLDRVVAGIASATRNSSMPARGLEASRFRAGIAKRLATIPVLLGVLGLILLLTTAVTLANNNAISIRERTIEVATLRVLGFYPRSILRVLVTESALVGMVGGFVAVAVIWLAFPAGFQLTPYGLLPAAKLTPVSMAVGIGIAILVPLLGALPSAYRAVRMPLVDGLRATA